MSKWLIYVWIGLTLSTMTGMAQADTLLSRYRESVVTRGGIDITRLEASLRTKSEQERGGSWVVLAQTQQMSPCDDSRYLALKTMPLDSMTQRQYEYFQQKDKDCTEFQRLHFNQPRVPAGAAAPQVTHAPPPEPANGGMGAGTIVLLAILGTVTFLVVLGAIAQ